MRHRVSLARRLALKLLAVTAGLSAIHPRAVGARATGALAPYLDTLIPADTTPSASALGIDRALLARGRADPNLGRLLDAGLAWLDNAARQQGARDFAALSETARGAVIRLADAMPRGSLANRFFRVTRHYAFRDYYAHPDAWPGPGPARPPQPEGYPDFDRPPERGK